MAMRQFSEAKPYGAKPGYIKWKPVPDPLPGVNRPVYWGTEILQQASIGIAIGFVFAGAYWAWKEALARSWVKGMRAYIFDYQTSRVAPRRDQLAKDRETPWWDKLSPQNSNDLEEMKRFIWAASAETDDERFQILNLPKPWDQEAENKARDRVMNFSEYPNYFQAEMPELESDDGDDDGDDED